MVFNVSKLTCLFGFRYIRSKSRVVETEWPNINIIMKLKAVSWSIYMQNNYRYIIGLHYFELQDDNEASANAGKNIA